MLTRIKRPERQNVCCTDAVRFAPDHKCDRFVIGYSDDRRIESDADGEALIVLVFWSALRFFGRRFSPARKFHIHRMSSPCSP